MDKRELRARMRSLRAGYVGRPLVAPAVLRARFTAGAVVAAYVPVRGEIDPAPLVESARQAGCRIALPHVVDRATPMRFLAADAELAAGPFGLTQPSATAEPLEPDVVITPLLAFDRAGNRLGQGAGYYDRAFAAHPRAWRVGVAWSLQEVDLLPADAWDVPLHAILTEQEWIEPMSPQA